MKVKAALRRITTYPYKKETTIMNNQDNLKPENQQSVTDDLTMDEAQSTAVKGGPIYMNYEGISGDVTTAGYDKWVSANRRTPGYDFTTNPKV
jgi:hypothetical protein